MKVKYMTVDQIIKTYGDQLSKKDIEKLRKLTSKTVPVALEDLKMPNPNNKNPKD